MRRIELHRGQHAVPEAGFDVVRVGVVGVVAQQPDGEVGEVASVALFLACDMSSYMTGTVLEVTGGRFM